MIGIYNTITIDGTEFPRPNDFEIQREDIYAGEYETCTGKIIADRIGWRFSETELTFDTLPDHLLQVLVGLSGEVTMGFTDSDGTSHQETIVRTSFVNTPTRYTFSDGTAIWKNISVQVRFINAHND